MNCAHPADAPKFPAMRLLWIKAVLLLAGIWLVVGGIMMWARSAKPTPDSIAKYLDTHSLDGRSPSERKEIIENFAGQLTRLDFDERRETRMAKRPDQFFKFLTPEEQAHFIDLTVPSGFKQMMEALNKMTPAKRAEFVGRALSDMRREREEGGEPPPKLDDPNVQKIVNTGLKSFFSEASPETKMDLAPLIEEMQRNLSGR